MYPQGQHILVIDNDSGRRRLSAHLLAGEGFSVTEAPEGFSAIRAADDAHFSLALTATSLPGSLDGPTTVQQIRARQPWLKALFTGNLAARPPAPDDRDDFIATPFDGRELLGCVFELLQREAGRAPAGLRSHRHLG